MKARTRIAVLVGVVSLAGLAGCAAPTHTAPPAAPPFSAAPGTDTGSDAAKALEAKRALFDSTNLRTSRGPTTTGTAFLAGLAAAGFAADSLEATTDVTSVGLTAPSIQFAARVDTTCLIGQYGPDGTGYRSITAAPIATGHCLIGAPGQAAAP